MEEQSTPSWISHARSEFLERYYQWSLGESLRELDQDFPFLRSVKSVTGVKYIEFLASLPKHERRNAVMAKVKSFHLERMARYGATREEGTNTDSESNSEQIALSFRQFESKTETDLYDRKLSNPRLFRIDKRVLRQQVSKDLVPVLGKPKRTSIFGGTLWYSTTIDDWFLETVIDTPRIFSLTYSHAIRARDRQPLVEWVSIFSWMGIASQTYWNFLTQDDIEPAAASVTKLCAHFVKAAQGLLKDLSGAMK